MHTTIVSLSIIVSILLLLQCAGSPRYTRAAPQKTPSQKKTTHQIASSSKNSKTVPAKPVQTKKQPVQHPKSSTSTSVTASKNKEVEIRTASAPEMRFPSGPSMTQSDEEIRETLSSSDYRLYQKGKASYYSDKLHGRKTANGERYNKKALTAAHRKLPFNTKVKVTNARTKQSVVVRINDRGPFVKGRVIDVSRAAAEKIGLIKAGIADVVVEILE